MSQNTQYRVATNNSSGGGGPSTTAQLSFAQRVNTDITTNDHETTDINNFSAGQNDWNKLKQEPTTLVKGFTKLKLIR